MAAIARDAFSDLIEPSRLRLGGKLGVRDQASAHADKVGFSFFKDFVGKDGIIDASRHKDRRPDGRLHG